MRRLRKLIVWMTVIYASVLASGCATPPSGDYCGIAQRPFEWRSDAEIDAAPIRALRYIETDAQIWVSQGCPAR